MKSKLLSLFQLAAILLLPPSLGSAFSQQIPQNYDLINLGTGLGGNFAIATGISSFGYIGGYANLPGNAAQHAILWLPGSIRDLGTGGGPNSALLNQFSGFSETTTKDPLGQDFCGTGTHLVCLPFLAAIFGTQITLPLLGGQNGSAFGNNDLGQVAGVSQTTTHDPSCLVGGQPVAPFYQVQQEVPVFWSNNKVTQLPLYSGDTEGGANAVNDLGQVVGATGNCLTAPTAHGLLWQNGVPTSLGNLGGSLNTNPFAINNLGQVTGTSDLAGDLTSHAFLWQKGVMTDLGTLPGDYYSVGYAINDTGQIVGQSCDVNRNCRAFVWSNGVMTDLNTRIPANSQLYLYLAATIDDLGVVGGYAVDTSNNTQPGFILTPSLTPAAAADRQEIPRLSVPPEVKTQIKPNLRTQRGARQ